MSPLAYCTASHVQKWNYRHSEVGKMDVKLLRFCLLLQIREPVHDISFEATKETNKQKKQCITTGGVETPKLWVYGLVAIDKCV